MRCAMHRQPNNTMRWTICLQRLQCFREVRLWTWPDHAHKRICVRKIQCYVFQLHGSIVHVGLWGGHLSHHREVCWIVSLSLWGETRCLWPGAVGRLWWTTLTYHIIGGKKPRGTSYSSLYGEAPPVRGTFFRSQASGIWKGCADGKAEGLKHWTCNPEAPSSSPSLNASWICTWYSRVQILGHAWNRQLGLSSYRLGFFNILCSV